MSRRGTGFWLMAAAALVIVATIVASVVVMGSPTVQRARKLDAQRTMQLQMIEREVRSYQRREGRLPSGLNEALGAGVAVADPQTGAAYEYAATAADRFRLCATFSRASADDDRGKPAPYDDLSWRHPAGRHCFDFRVEAGDKAK